MAALQTVLAADDVLLLYEVEVLVELAHLDVADAAGHVDLAIVEEHAGVVVDARDGLHVPLALGVAGREDESSSIVAVDEDIELAVVILHRAGPHASGVGILSSQQRIAVLGRELGERLCAILPVHQILRLHNGGTGEVVHGGADHVVGVAHADDIGVGEVGKNDGVLVLAVALVAVDHVLEVGVCPVHLIVISIPIHAGFAAGFLIAVESGHHRAVGQQLVDVDETGRAREGHRDVSKVVEHGLVSLAPLRGASRGPCAPVRLHPVAVLIIVASALLRGTPVHFGDDDGVGVHHWHLLVELVNLVLWVGCSVATAVPSAVVVHGIADVVALNGIGGIAGVVGLPACTGHPDDACEAVSAYAVDDGLEEVVKRLRVILTLGVLQRYRFIGQLNANLSGILLDGVVLREGVPHRHQVVVVVVAYL